MRTAYVVMTYNRPDALLAVLRGLARRCGPQDLVVVADDGSREASVQQMRAGLPAMPCPMLHVWHPDKGFTLARSRNLGAAAALARGADYLVFLDGDCVPGRHFAAGHRALARPGHFVTGSRVLLSERFTAEVIAGRVDPDALGLAGSLRHRLAGDLNKLAHLACWPGLPGRDKPAFVWRGIRGCNLAMWAADYAAVNGCDESFSGWGHEDADLVLRLHNHGLVRTNGHLATEVFHLWHPENSRAQEAANRARVTERIAQGLRRASAGLDEARLADDVVHTPLN